MPRISNHVSRWSSVLLLALTHNSILILTLNNFSLVGAKAATPLSRVALIETDTKRDTFRTLNGQSELYYATLTLIPMPLTGLLNASFVISERTRRVAWRATRTACSTCLLSWLWWHLLIVLPTVSRRGSHVAIRDATAISLTPVPYRAIWTNNTNYPRRNSDSPPGLIWQAHSIQLLIQSTPQRLVVASENSVPTVTRPLESKDAVLTYRVATLPSTRL